MMNEAPTKQELQSALETLTKLEAHIQHKRETFDKNHPKWSLIDDDFIETLTDIEWGCRAIQDALYQLELDSLKD